jgi:ankyrin repeat protein
MTAAKELAEAVWNGDQALVATLIGSGADPNAADDHRMPPLHLAIEQMDLEITRRLIEAGANVNRDSGDGWTPLVHAIDIESDAAWQAHHETGRESTALVQLLLASGANPTARAFELANEYGNEKAVSLLNRTV